jgi:hypothetical protein
VQLSSEIEKPLPSAQRSSPDRGSSTTKDRTHRSSRITRDSVLDDLSRPCQPVLLPSSLFALRDRPVGSRVFLKAVELVELASDRKVGDEMVGVLFFAGLEGGIDGEGVGAGKGVVSLSDLRRV